MRSLWPSLRRDARVETRTTGCHGHFLGLGALTRGYVVLVVLALLLASVRSDRLRAAVWVAGAALASATAYALVFLAIQPGAFTASYTSWWQAKAGYGSPWLFPTIGTYELPSWSVTVLAVIGITVALMLGWIFARDALRPPTWAQVAFVVVAVAMMTAKAVPVQASLWLLPLAAAAGVRWRDHLIWVGTELAHFIAIWLYVGALTHADRASQALGMPSSSSCGWRGSAISCGGCGSPARRRQAGTTRAALWTTIGCPRREPLP